MAKKKNKRVLSKKTVLCKTETENLAGSLNSEIFTVARNPINQHAKIVKVCRLCENKDGPFLEIFETDTLTAKKIDEILPFVISENDDLPHKICFRCSAKVEELHEFVQKCINTQNNLRNAVGKDGPLKMKKSRSIWEEKLNQSNMINEYLCDAVTKKAMKGLSDIPILPLQVEERNVPKNEPNYITKINEKEDEITPQNTDNTKDSPQLRQLKMEIDKIDENITKKTTRSAKLKNLNDKNIKKDKHEKTETDQDQNQVAKTNALSLTDDIAKDKPPDAPKSFDIMDHVSMIKVNGVGVLFQCKLCNRNFLRKEVVMVHGCSKNGGKKIAEEAKPLTPEPPKIPLIKYINTKHQSEVKKPPLGNTSPINLDDDEDDKKEINKPLTMRKHKPKIGPASKMKRFEKDSVDDSTKNNQSFPAPQTNSSTPIAAPTIQFPSLPQLNSRYKLVPGPNNTFTLVEDSSVPIPAASSSSATASSSVKSIPTVRNIAPAPKPPRTPELNTITTASAPYPVGLIKKVSHHSPPFPNIPTPVPETVKKQSYTIVQTGNPSKLLISTKPQPVAEEVPKKKPRKANQLIHEEQPYSVVLEHNEPPKNAGFFTFVNVDPLLQPSYVLPTNNIIQESQISTSTNKVKPVEDKEKDKYSCNLCGEKFSREKKLLTHIQSHYSKMDEEDQMRAQRSSKKRK